MKLPKKVSQSKKVEFIVKQKLNKSTENKNLKLKHEFTPSQPNQRYNGGVRSRLRMLDQLAESVKEDSSSEYSMPNIKICSSEERLLNPYKQNSGERNRSTINQCKSQHLRNPDSADRHLNSYLSNAIIKIPQKKYKVNHRHFEKKNIK